MGYSVRPVDITRYSCDVVINSLGINTTIYGKLCENIVKEASSSEYKKKLSDINGKVNIGDLIITPGYQLKAKYIYNVVTPFYKQDKKLRALEFVYTKVLLEAKKHNLKKIAVPIIGTGFNGYPHVVVYRMVEELLKAFTKAYPKMNVTLCMPVVSQDEYSQKFDQEKLLKSLEDFYKKNDFEVREFSYSKSYFELFEDDIDFILANEQKPIARNIYRDRGIYQHPSHVPFLNESEIYLEAGERPVNVDMNKLPILSVSEYIDTYINNRWLFNEERKVIRKHIEDKFLNTSLKSKHNDESKRTTISPNVLMRYVLSLHMNEEEAKQFFLFCGRGFSLISKEDVVYLYFIRNKIYGQAEVNACCEANKITCVFYEDYK